MKTPRRLPFLEGFRRRYGLLTAPVAFATLVPLLLLPTQTLALPTGGQVVAGQVGSVYHGPQLTLDQASPTAIMNWQSFDIASGESVRVLQPGTDAAMLARVTGGNPSELLGRLQADGRLFLINPRGILVGQGAVIDTAAFLASTLDVADADFLKNGPLTFQGDSAAGVVNLGTITAREGNVLLLAHTVRNAGTILAANGTAGLGAGTEVTLASPGDSAFVVKFNLPVTAEKTGVENAGVIAAAQAQLETAGGSIYDLAVNQSGTIRATGVERQPDGRVLLTAAGANVAVTGAIVARQADGSGGEILVGGDYQGGNAAVANAARTLVGPAARLDASASSAAGTGGRVIVWADDVTRFAGAITAKAGALGGDGGFAEVSGKRSLGFAGTVDLSAPAGASGRLLLDPDTITIVAGSTSVPAGLGDGNWTSAEDPGSQNLGADTLAGLLATANVTLQAATSLTVNSEVNVASGGTSGVELALDAPTIALNDTVSLANVTNGQIKLFGTTSGSLTSAAGATLNAPKVTISEFPTVTLNGPVVTSELIYLSLGSPAAFSATHANNDIPKFVLNTDLADPQAVTFSGSVAVNSESALQVQALIGGATGVTFSTAGDLTLLGVNGITPATRIASSGTVKLASTGGVLINQAGTGLFSGAGRRLLYTSEVGGSFSLGGLTGFTQFDGIAYPNDPQGAVTLVLYNAAGAAVSVLTITAADFVRLYGQADPTFTASYSGGTAADLTTLPSFSIQGGPAVNVGTYTIVPSGAVSSTHTLNYANGTLTVNPATLTYVATVASRIYGGANPAFGGTVTGFVNGDTLASATSGTLAFASTATAANDAGSYAINGSGLMANHGNYQFAQASSNATAFTIGKAPLTLGGNVVNVAWGDPVTLGYNVFGLLGSDTAAVLSGVSFTPLPANAAPGSYFLNFTSAGTATNYVVTGTLPAIVSITRRPVTLSADDVSSLAGALPPFTTRSSIVPLAGGPQFTLRASTTATSASPAGTYAITPVIVPLDGSTVAEVERYYTFTIKPGTLTLKASGVDKSTLLQPVTEVIIVSGPKEITVNDVGLKDLTNPAPGSDIKIRNVNDPLTVQNVIKGLSELGRSLADAASRLRTVRDGQTDMDDLPARQREIIAGIGLTSPLSKVLGEMQTDVEVRKAVAYALAYALIENPKTVPQSLGIDSTKLLSDVAQRVQDRRIQEADAAAQAIDNGPAALTNVVFGGSNMQGATSPEAKARALLDKAATPINPKLTGLPKSEEMQNELTQAIFEELNAIYARKG